MSDIRPARPDPYTLLRRKIVELNLLPGAFISENCMGSQLHTGRAQIRQALACLSSEGCVEVFPQRGVQISLISMERARQALFLRTTLEQDVLRQLCTIGLSDRHFQLLEESLSRQRALLESRSVSDLLREDDFMHRLFFEFADRLTGWEASCAMDVDLLRLRCLSLMTYNCKQASMTYFDGWADGITEHRMLFDYLKVRDTEAAVLLCKLHLERAERDGLSLQRIYPQYFAAVA